KVTDIPLAEPRRDFLRVGMLQLDTPFYDQIDKQWDGPCYVFGATAMTEVAYRARISRIHANLGAMRTQNHKVDVLAGKPGSLKKSHTRLFGFSLFDFGCSVTAKLVLEMF
ncbi:MAG TPA: hypothetical protein PJ991_12185, partial [Kiritimatiellia bacterium]|nr:hypothetical protein [Kiritimatiellia bacterium]